MLKILRDFVHGRFLGHPIHAMLVHFPAALIPTSLIFEIVGWFTKNNLFSAFAFYTLAIGVLVGVVAAIFGSIDYARLPPEHIAWKKASLHGLLNVIWLMVFGVFFGAKISGLSEYSYNKPS